MLLRTLLLAAVLAVLVAATAEALPKLGVASGKHAVRSYLEEEERTGGNAGFRISGCGQVGRAVSCKVTEYGVLVEVSGAECPCELNHRITAWRDEKRDIRLKSSLFGSL